MRRPGVAFGRAAGNRARLDDRDSDTRLITAHPGTPPTRKDLIRAERTVWGHLAADPTTQQAGQTSVTKFRIVVPATRRLSAVRILADVLFHALVNLRVVIVHWVQGPLDVWVARSKLVILANG